MATAVPVHGASFAPPRTALSRQRPTSVAPTTVPDSTPDEFLEARRRVEGWLASARAPQPSSRRQRRSPVLGYAFGAVMLDSRR